MRSWPLGAAGRPSGASIQRIYYLDSAPPSPDKTYRVST